MERETPDYRSNVIYVYDSDPEAERCPYTIAVVMPRRINLQSLLGRLNLQTDCPPHVLENLCSLWFGRIPIGTHHEVNVLMGNAFRLIIGGGIRLDVPHLLLLENSQIRSILQRAIRSEIFDRPTEPSFVNVFATPADSPCASGYVEMTADNRPSWIPVVEQHFRRGHQREPPDYHPTLTVQVWYRLTTTPLWPCKSGTLIMNLPTIVLMQEKLASLTSHSCGVLTSFSDGGIVSLERHRLSCGSTQSCCGLTAGLAHSTCHPYTRAAFEHLCCANYSLWDWEVTDVC